MMTEPRDDELTAMLEARADRLRADAAREVMAAVREETRGPKGGAAFAVLPVAMSRGMHGPAGWAALGLVAVLVLAVMGGRLGSGPAQPSGNTASGGPPSSSAVSSASTPPATRVAASPAISTVTMDQLRAGLADGTLEGWTVLATGRLELQPWPCPSPMPEDCYGLRLPGLDGVEVTHAGVLTADEALARIQGDATDRPMAFRVEGGQLALLGWVTQGAEEPLTVAQLLRGGEAPGRAEVAAVAGWLLRGVSNLASCPGSVAAPCTDTRPVLADTEPTADGQPTTGDAIEVTVDDRLGLAPAPATIAGPFLVRYAAYRGGDLPPWGVVATLDPTTTVRVGTLAASAAMTADQLRAAVEDGSMDGRVVAITGWLQPSGGPCPADVPQPCTKFVILGLGDVAVTWDGALPTTTRVDDASPDSSPVGTLLLAPRDGHLVLLGRLTGDLERPSSLPELLSQRRLMRFNDPFALTAVSGWLVVGGIHSCPMLGPGATPCPGPPPALTDKEPLPDGMLKSDVQVEVAVWPGAVGIDPAQVVTPGPILFRTVVNSTCRDQGVVCAGGPTWSWEVMARYDTGSVDRVILP